MTTTLQGHPIPLVRSLLLAALLPAGCGGPSDHTGSPTCDPGNGGITLPQGFCALVVADSEGPAQHLDVAPNGDVFVALRSHPSGSLYGVIHGRDQLSALWSEHFSHEKSAEKPSEEFVQIEEGDDFGWPHCCYDPASDLKALAQEYGGDGEIVGRGASMKDPIIGFPAHWAPNDLEFYAGDMFPKEYRGGALVAFHGSWNRAPLPQAGYKVAFAPFRDGEATGEWSIFTDGFAGGDRAPRGARRRPVGLAQDPDGSLCISDGQVGRIWRVLYLGRSCSGRGRSGLAEHA